MSHPLPNSRWDCETPRTVFRELPLGAIRACLASIEAGTTVVYRLRRSVTPSFTLKAEAGASPKIPECLQHSLPELPVPREIFFQTYRSDRPICFSSRLDIEKDEFWDLKMPFNHTVLKLEFPLPGELPRDDAETLRLLTTWVMAPFASGPSRLIGARLVPDAICRPCIGEKGMITDRDPPQPLWPEGPADE